MIDENRGPVWLADDGTYHSTKAARDAHEGCLELVGLMAGALKTSDDPNDLRELAKTVANEIITNPWPVLAAMRKAGVKVIERKAKPAPRAPRKPKRGRRKAAEILARAGDRLRPLQTTRPTSSMPATGPKQSDDEMSP